MTSSAGKLCAAMRSKAAANAGFFMIDIGMITAGDLLLGWGLMKALVSGSKAGKRVVARWGGCGCG